MSRGFVSPQLASPFNSKHHDLSKGNWVAEEKFDGHRLILEVDDRQRTLLGDKKVTAWSRNGIARVLPPHIRDAAQVLPGGTYDGELLVPGHRSYGVTELGNTPSLVYVVFDIIQLLEQDCTVLTDRDRRALLNVMFSDVLVAKHANVIRLAQRFSVTTMEQIKALAKTIWDRDGEGLIVKKLDAKYMPGKRSRDWFKIKTLRSEVLTLVGFQAGLMGPRSVAMLRDSRGNETTVKWKDHAWLKLVETNGDKFIGRKVRIEFQERTPDGGYRHPRWDRWEDE